VLQRIGAGGMGVVYRARDERLRREVAIKVLPAGTLDDPERRARFHREAVALAQLNHPGIATLFEFDRAGDLDFLVMEHVAGETLERHLARAPLAEGEIVALGLQIAEALAAAHEQGVVHRDLKPGNVIVTPRGRVKLLDFGVAKFVGGERAEVDPLRTTGASAAPGALGTLPYMAPEQLLDTGVDARTDLYALGVVLYRMATGRLPFEGLPPLALMNRILNEPPAPPGALRTGLSPRIEGVILRCLEKEPARRPASAQAVAAELRPAAPRAPGDAHPPAPAERPAHPALESLVVLPLENLSGDPGQEYFADGMTDVLIANLARIGALRVISRTSAMRFKGARRPLPEIARELGVEAVVEGTVLRSGDRVRITAQLVEAPADRTLWTFSVEREVRDVLALQSEVARAVAEEIRVRVTPLEMARLREPRPVDPRALEHVLRGRFLWNKRTAADVERSIELFRAALEIAPDYAAAWSGLADAWSIVGAFRFQPPAVAFARAEEAARHALELDPDLAEAHTSLAFALQHSAWDLPAAEASFRRARELNPSYVLTRHWYAELLLIQERFDEAAGELRRARELDPLSPIVVTTEGSFHYFARRYPESLALLDTVVELHPDFVVGHLDRGRTLEELGRLEEARAEFTAATRITGSDPGESAPLAHLYALLGERARAEAVIGRLRDAGAHRYVSPYSIATVYSALRDADRAFEWLEQAFATRDPMMIYLRVHPRLDPLRADPRFAELLRRAGLAR
jgi:TolB-like protein/tetratricopeptide (TPR) repeat protein